MCLTPIRIKAKKRIKNELGHDYISNQGYATVPCGKCPKCKQKRANAWAFRIEQEERRHTLSVFATLTYDNTTVPKTKNGYKTLVKSDLQKFFKRLRKNTGIKTIKYYACGEYGGETWRPHYHAIIFDVKREQIEKAWKLGYIDVGKVEAASIRYVTKYICKDEQIPLHAKDDRLREFSLMSKNLGKNYLEKNSEWHKENMESYVVQPGGYKQAMPRYYRNLIFDEEEKEILNNKQQEKANEKFETGVREAGSQKEYYRLRFETAKALKRIAIDNQKKRKKL